MEITMNEYKITISDIVTLCYNLKVHTLDYDERQKIIPKTIQDLIAHETEW